MQSRIYVVFLNPQGFNGHTLHELMCVQGGESLGMRPNRYHFSKNFVADTPVYDDGVHPILLLFNVIHCDPKCRLYFNGYDMVQWKNFCEEFFSIIVHNVGS